MTHSAIPALLPAGTFAAAVVVAMVGLASARAARVVALVAIGVATIASTWALIRAVDDGPLVHPLGGWAAPLGIEYVLDPLAGFITVLIGVIGFLVLLYPSEVGFGVPLERGPSLHALVLLLLGGLFGVAVAGDLFNLFVSLEIYSIASYALIALGGPAAALASFRYLLIGTVSSSIYLLGVGFVYFTTGTLSMSEVGPLLTELVGSPTTAAATAMIVIGLGTKMAVFTLHGWLPDAHSHAPPAVAALLAAVQVKVAAYALIRILFDVFPARYVVDEVPVLTLLTWFGAAGVIIGSVLAIRQDDIKRMLAHSTVAQIGFIAVGIGLATPTALVGALLHVANHAAMKAALFFVAGGIIMRAGTKRISEMGGLGPRFPVMMAAFTVGAVSMVGLPPTAGFFSKWYLASGAIDTDRWVVAAVIVGSSVLTLIYFLRIIELVWFRPSATAPVDREVRAPVTMMIPIVVLAVAIIALGVGNVFLVEHVLEPLAQRLVG